MLKSLRLRWARHVVWMVDGKRAHKLLLGKPEGKRPCDRPRIRWEDNIIWDLKDYEDNGNVCYYSVQGLVIIPNSL